MKKTFVLLTLLIILISSAAQAATVIKLASLAPEGSTWDKTLRAMNEEIKSQTGGNVSLQIYSGGVAGDEKDVLRKMRIGQIHAGAFTGVGLGQIVPATRILELPLLFNSYEEVDYVKEKIRPELEKAFSAKGFELLGWAEAGFVNIFSNKAIAKQSDMEGVKCWVWEGDPLAQAMTEALGIAPIPLSMPDVLTSLQTNLIDCVYGPPLAVLVLQWGTKVSHLTDIKLANSTGALLVSKKIMAKLSPEEQKILKTVIDQYSKQLVTKIRQENTQALESLKNNGIQVVKVAPKDLEELKKLSSEVWPKLVGKLYSAELLAKVQGYLKEKRGK
ncbi:MAG: TRAP transporter substrate-binding protein DctP [Deltaproteobacteria bacterium]|nr:TRAP transporter substrate-binding protein DctP [Deltaproteobacteria bacterium]